MTTMETTRLVDDYLRRLDAAAAHVQRSRRVELVAEIREHIDAALREEDVASEAAVRNVLERLGPPEEIVDADAPAQSARRAGALEIAALVALVLPLIGWLIGIVLVLVSQAWSSRDKLIGIALALIPALIPVAAIAVGSSSGGSEVVDTGTPVPRQPLPGEESGAGHGGVGAVEVLVLVFGFFFAGLPSALFLGWRLRRSPTSA